MSTDPILRKGYRRCAQLTWQYGTTYYWGALLLPKQQRKHVYAVYALCRLADDIVDLPEMRPEPVEGQQQREKMRSGPVEGQQQHEMRPEPVEGQQQHEMRPEPVEGQQQGASTSSASIQGASTSSASIQGASTSSAGIQGASTSSASIQGASTRSAASTTEARLQAFADQFRTALIDRGSDDPVMAAIVHTVITCGIEPECFDRFFGAMAMDLTTSRYETWADLCGYMEGSAAVIGEMMLPVLEPTSPRALAPARSLGLAFQLTNFLRDVDEDLDRGRVYLPQEDLRRFGVDLTSRRVTPEWRAFLAYEIERNRALYAFADTGIALLPPRSARCVGTARVLYAQILDKIEQRGYNVFSARARVPTWRKAGTAASIMVAGPPRPQNSAELEGWSTSSVTSNAP